MKKILTLILLTPFIFACTNEGNEEQMPTENIEEVVVLAPHDLILNDNEKWVIDEGMRVNIDSIQHTLANFNGNDSIAYKNLSADLARQTKSVINSCTMKGQAHDELHKWLMPFIALRKTIEPAGDAMNNQEIIAELKGEIEVFHTYFN